MNQNRKEELLTCWMDGTLSSEELSELEPVLAGHPELQREREEYVKLREDLQATIPAELEPPYPDFFNAHLERLVHGASRSPHAGPGGKTGLSRLWNWWMVPAGLAALLAAFMAGTLLNPSSVPPPLSAATAVYAPNKNVEAAAVDDKDLQATVIVLTGLADLPDENLIGWGGGSHSERPGLLISAFETY